MVLCCKSKNKIATADSLSKCLPIRKAEGSSTVRDYSYGDASFPPFIQLATKGIAFKLEREICKQGNLEVK